MGMHNSTAQPSYEPASWYNNAYSGVAAFAFGEGAKLAPRHPALSALPPVF